MISLHSLARGEPIGTPVLQVQCGSCNGTVKVYPLQVPNLLYTKRYICNNCNEHQSIDLDAATEESLRQQAVSQLRLIHRNVLLTIQQAQNQRIPVPKNVLDIFRQITGMLNPLQSTGGGQLPHHMHHRPPSAYQGGPGRPPGSMARPPPGQYPQPMHGYPRPMGHPASMRPPPSGSATAGNQPLHNHVHDFQRRLQQQQQQFLQQHQQQQPLYMHQQQQLQGGAVVPGNMNANHAMLLDHQRLAAQLQHQQRLQQKKKDADDEEEDDLLHEDEDDADEGEIRDTFMEYKPMKLSIGHMHPDPVVETASLAAVEPPDVTYELAAKKELVDEGRLSALQLEAVVYACQRHEHRLPSGARGGFFIGDGAGVGKGRTIAGLILENWRRGRRRHIWVSVGSDLKLDAQRDLHDVGAADIPVHALNKLPYGKLAGHKINVQEGVIFLTYSSLISSSDRGMSRFKQLVEWCGNDFDGLIVFDESHKAKNLVPEAGSRPTQVGLRVQHIQRDLPGARIVYCSATGASEPRNMGYMTRLGLWGEGHAGFPDFSKFLEAVAGKQGTASGGNMAALELVAMDMKAQGMYVCRTLSFASAEFETLRVDLEEPVASQYKGAAMAWNEIYREFMYGEEKVQEAVGIMENAERKIDDILDNDNGGKNDDGGDGNDDDVNDDATAANGGVGGATTNATTNKNTRNTRDNNGGGSGAVSNATGGPSTRRGGGGNNSFGGSMMWRSFWAAHQRFFRHMCIAAKVPAAVRMAQEALLDDKCVVIGLQSTGEARTADVIAEKGEELDDFVSGPKELLIRLVDQQYPIPAHPDEIDDGNGSDSDSDGDEEFENERITEAAAKGTLETREVSRRSRGQQVRYKEYASDEDIGATDSDSDSEDDSEDDESGSGEEEEGSREDSASNAEDDDDGDNEESSSDDDDDDNSSSSDDDDDDPTYASKKRNKKDDDEDKLTPEEQQRHDAAEEIKKTAREQIIALREEALKRKEKLKQLVSSLELPTNPLDDLIDRLGGPAMVAEMTGRKSRLVRDVESGTVKFEPRNASGVEKGATLEMINVHERELFLDGAKLIAIISEAASAGISLHADRRVPNQRRRVHITLELPWSADKAIQQFGRSHRANQAHGPQYRLVFTPLGGEKRFAAAVARRLESLGALTQGDRRAGPSLAEFNYESTWGQRALRMTYNMLLGDATVPPALVPLACQPQEDDQPPIQPLPKFLSHSRALLLNAGLIRLDRDKASPLDIHTFLNNDDGAPYRIGTIEDKEKADVPRFLNRLLGLDPNAQSQLFDFYQSTLDDMLEHARRDGTFDEGILDLKAFSIEVDGEGEVLYQDPVSKASTVMYTVKIDRGLPWESAEEMLKEHTGSGGGGGGDNGDGSSQNEGKGDGDGVVKEEEEEMKDDDDNNDDDNDNDVVGEKRSRPSDNGDKNGDDKEQEDDGSDEPDSKRVKTEDAGDIKKEEEDNNDDDNNTSSATDKDKDNDKDKNTTNTPTKKTTTTTTTTTIKKREYTTGFYRTKQEGLGNRVFVMLALQIPETSPPSYIIYRPGTGKARKPFSQAAIKEKYLPLSIEEAKPLWIQAHTASGMPKKEGKPSTRHRTVHILSGAVMQSWNIVHKSMLRYVKSKERRMRVMRIATTGENFQRLVGMFVPEDAVESVMKDLKVKHEEMMEKQSVIEEQQKERREKERIEAKEREEKEREAAAKREEKKAQPAKRKSSGGGAGKKENDDNGGGGKRMTRSSSMAKQA